MENQTITNKLHQIQLKLVAPKDQVNSFGKYKYRSCEGIMNALKPLLTETNTVVMITDELVQLGDRFYVKATAILSDGENQIFTSAFAREPQNKKGNDEAQITGATSSYARKYALNGLFCIDDTKDADYLNNGKETPSERISMDQLSTLLDLFDSIPDAPKKRMGFLKFMKVDSFENILVKDYQKAFNAVESSIKKIKESK